MKIVDTHQHLWDLDLLSYSWCKGHPVFGRSFRLDARNHGESERQKLFHDNAARVYRLADGKVA